MSANHHCDDFQKKNRVDKLNVIILSDGDSHKAASRYRTSGISIFEGKKIDISFSRTYEFVQNTRTVRDNQQESALEILRRKANVIGMFLPTSKKDVKRKLALAGESSFKKLEKRYKKDSSISIPDCVGYDSLILLSSNLSVSEEEFEYSTDENISESRAAQNKLAKEFSRVNSKNKKSRVLLTNFAQLIA